MANDNEVGSIFVLDLVVFSQYIDVLTLDLGGVGYAEILDVIRDIRF